MPHVEKVLGPQSDSLLQEMGQSLVWLQLSPISTKKGPNQILGLPTTIATGSLHGSGLGPFGTTTGSGSGSGPSASLSAVACPVRNNTIYTNDFGTEYNTFCGRDLIGDAAISSHTDSFEKCLDFCDIFGGCGGVTYTSANSSSQANCLPHTTFSGYAEGKPLLVSGVAINGPVINKFAERILCPALDNQTISDPFSNSYLIGCDKTLSGNADIAPTVLRTLAACLVYCSLDDGCSAVTFTGYPPPATGAAVSYNCFPRSSTVSGLKKRQNTVISSEIGSQFAERAFLDQGGGAVTSSGSVPVGVTSTQTTGPVFSGPGGVSVTATDGVASTQSAGPVFSGPGDVSATGTGGSFPGSGNSTQTGGPLSPTGTGTTGPGAGNSTQTGGVDGASSAGTIVASVTEGSGNATGTSTGIFPPSPSNILSCSGSNNTQYTDEFNTSYNITCGLDIIGSNAVASHADSFAKCISFCDILSGCAGVTYKTSSASNDSTCQPYSFFNEYRPIPAPNNLLAAIPAKDILVNNTFSYDQLCPDSSGRNITDRYGVTYTIGCGGVISGTDLPPTVLRSLNACLLYCSLFGEGCAAVTFTGYPPGLVPSGADVDRKRQANPANCFPKISTGPVEVIVPQAGASYAKRVSPALAVGSDDSNTGPGASSTSGVPGNPTSSAGGNPTVVAGASPTSSVTGPTTPSGIAGNPTSAATSGSSSTSGAPPVGNSTSSLQPSISTTPGRSLLKPSSTWGPRRNSTSGVPPTGSVGIMGSGTPFAVWVTRP